MKQQKGYFLMLAIVFILVMGFMGSLISYLFANRASTSVAELNGLNAFYIAESGLEIGERLLSLPNLGTTPARVSCAALNGLAQVTNVALGRGAFKLTSVNGGPTYAITSLSSAITTSSTTISVANAANFATAGRIMIDQEAMDYTDISGNTFIGVTRGTNGAIVSSHAVNAPVAQYQCTIDSQAGVPNMTTLTYQREIQAGAQLEDAWMVGNASSKNYSFVNWNRLTELDWSTNFLSGNTASLALNAISMLSDADGWAVGNTSSTSTALNFKRWNGSAWISPAVTGACAGENLLGVSMISSTEGWAVGTSYPPGCMIGLVWRYNILQWNGSSWVQLTPTSTPSIAADTLLASQNLNAVSVIDTTGNGKGNVGFAVGNAGLILSYNGSSWVKMTSPTTQNLFGVVTVSANQAWAVGAAGVIIRWNGTTWSNVTSPTTVQLNGIAMLDTDADGQANIGWAVGNTGRILIYNGTSWSSTKLDNTNYTSIAIFNASDAWIVGAGGSVAQWNGSTWAVKTSPLTAQINSISVIPISENNASPPISGWQQVFK